jgi:hypothetical protein
MSASFIKIVIAWLAFLALGAVEKTSNTVHLQKEVFAAPNKIMTPHIKQNKCKKKKKNLQPNALD